MMSEFQEHFKDFAAGERSIKEDQPPGDLRTDTFQHRITFVPERLRHNEFHPHRKQQPLRRRLAEQTQRPKLVSEVEL